MVSPPSPPTPTLKDDEDDSPDYCTRSYVRALTSPPLFPPSPSELERELRRPWNVRIPVDAGDDSTRVHWREQRRTPTFDRMFDWGASSAPGSAASSGSGGGGGERRRRRRSVAVLHPYFSFGSPSSPFFAPWEDAAHCLRHLLLHRIGIHQTSTYATLITHDTEVFLATAHNFDEGGTEMRDKIRISGEYYLLRCHHDRGRNRLVFGYHRREERSSDDDGAASTSTEGGGGAMGPPGPLVVLREVSLSDNDDWRLETCVVLKNLGRIINCLKDYAVPLTCNEKLSLVDGGRRVQKVYPGENICPIFDASVENMISVYEAIVDVPHTDKLVYLERGKRSNGWAVVCRFAPVGRSYLPADAEELLDALVCVAEALVALHSRGIMHRDIRWANVFHALRERPPPARSRRRNGDDIDDGDGGDGEEEEEREGRRRPGLEFTREWVLFDFEFAARSPQPPFGEHTLTPGNHAPEMIARGDPAEQRRPHTTAVDVWGLGYLIGHAEVDLPASHASDLTELREACMDPNPANRPSASRCWDILRELQSRPLSREKDVMYCSD